jgi:hypothetical protein
VSVRWSLPEFVRRVIVETATATGQPVRAVAVESFALTLWTWATIRQIEREAAVERMGERTDLAGLVAVAFHEPAKLAQAELRYLSTAGRLGDMLDMTRERLSGLAEQMQAAAARTTTAATPREG